jgi:hypothetical protein
VTARRYGVGVVAAAEPAVPGSVTTSAAGLPPEPTAGSPGEASAEALTSPVGWPPPSSVGRSEGAVVGGPVLGDSSGPKVGLAVLPLVGSDPVSGDVPEPGVVEGFDPGLGPELDGADAEPDAGPDAGPDA